MHDGACPGFYYAPSSVMVVLSISAGCPAIRNNR